MTDKIHPTYYDGDACMQCIASMTRSMSGPLGFCVGQAVKYLWRYGTKQGESVDDDCGKALWYIEWIRRTTPEYVTPKILMDLTLLAENRSSSALEVQLALTKLAAEQ